MGVDVVDIVAVILGIFFTIRKLDAQSRRPEDFPAVDRAAFLDWQARETKVYSAAVLACFLKVFLDLGFVYFLAEGLPYRAVQLVGAAIDLSWLGFVIFSLFRASRVREQRRRLGIYLGSRLPEPRPEDEDEEEPRGG